MRPSTRSTITRPPIKKDMESAAESSSITSTKSNATNWKIRIGRPRLFFLFFCFLTISACSVGYVAWWLTLQSANKTIVSQIQQIVANQMNGFVLETAASMRTVVSLQASMFTKNTWSFLPDRQNATLLGMFHLLQGVRRTTIDMYTYTYPEGNILGYFYPPDPSDMTLQMWTESNQTIYTWLCDGNGSPQGSPTSSSQWIGNGTIQNPGNNNTLQLMEGGIVGANIDFSNTSAHAVSGLYLWQGAAYKSFFQVAKNLVTGEVTTFGNDWTVSFLSLQMAELVSPIPYPIYTVLVEVSTGILVASSHNEPFVINGSLVLLKESNNTYIQKFCSYLDSVYPPDTDLPSQLLEVSNTIKSQGPLVVTISLNSISLSVQVDLIDTGDLHPMLFVQFLNIGEVLKDVRQLSYMTSLWISLLVLGFVVMGTIFAYIVSQQLHNVSKQIKMLKSLKFAEVVDKNKGVKGKSFIAELHELQQSFLEMVVVLAGAFKRNQSFAKGGGFATGGGRKMSASGQRNNDPPRSSVAMPPPTQNIFGPGPAGFSKENEHRSSKTRQSMQEGPVDDAIEARFMPRTQSLTAPPVNLLANFANMVASRKGSVEF